METAQETYRVLGVHATNSGYPVKNNMTKHQFTNIVQRAVIKAKTAQGSAVPDSYKVYPSAEDTLDAHEYLTLRMNELEEKDSVRNMLADAEKKFEVSDPYCTA